MNINKNSWHFKMNLWFKSDNMWKMPKTLCGYFWTTVLHVVFSSAIITFIGSVAWMFGWPIVAETGILAWMGISLSTFWLNVIAVPVGAAVIAAFMLLFAAIAFGFIFGLEKFKHYRIQKKYTKKLARVKAGLPAEAEPLVFIQYLKARKRKVCPMIDYVEGDK
ncbi:hypothetical protein SHINKOU_88 [Klebsiella phage vB_KaeM_Shinkou]|nr:hypothetical protein SHINKOU_88 [Klebsiella phage vB_KaeM_Shinkou]